MSFDVRRVIAPAGLALVFVAGSANAQTPQGAASAPPAPAAQPATPAPAAPPAVVAGIPVNYDESKVGS